MTDDHPLLSRTVAHATEFLDSLPDRPAAAAATAAEVHAALSTPLTQDGLADLRVIDDLVSTVTPGLVASAGPRYFGFVTGGAQPVALAADWLTAVWDQNGASEMISPAAAAAEAAAIDWARELLCLPDQASGAVVVGAQAGNTLGVTVARDALLRRSGWDAVEDGLIGAPPITVIAGEERHMTVDRALRFAGLGRPDILVASRPDGSMDPEALGDALTEASGAALVCAQAGNVNSGAFDPFPEVVAAARDHDAWVHVDGAFGLWAAASPARAHLAAGVESADSWVVDAHKWLNVPYDGALVFCAHPEDHQRSTSARAAYLPAGAGRDPMDWSQDASRRARGFVLHAAIRALGRRGVAELVDRCCDLAAGFAARIDGRAGLTVRNDVVLNQVVVDAGDGDRAERLVAAIQSEGTCWIGPTNWRGRPGLRISVSNWSSTLEDIERSAQALVTAAERL
jgi:glutamate/tyrosine decarboxylase-like PLP-dependent enzyme